MSFDGGGALSESHPDRLMRGAMWLLCAVVLLSTSGCSGCRQDADARKKAEAAKKKLEEKKKKEPRKPDFELDAMVVLPNDGLPIQRVKPGHWTGVSQSMRVNHFDFQGQATWVPVDRSGGRIALDRTGYRMSMSRPLSLAKKQKRKKPVEMVLFTPPGTGRQAVFAMELADRAGRRRLADKAFFRRMDAHEYFFVVLAREPDRYRFLKVQNSVVPPTSSDRLPSGVKYYEVVLPKIDRRVPLPASALTWTSIAYVLWDDLEPNRFSTEQQAAMLDWLHWGGQLLISGPGSLDTLRGSFLDSYLPATSGDAIELVSSDFQRINEQWTEPYASLRNRPLSAVRPWSAVDLKLAGKGAAVNVLASTPAGVPLLVERRVGRGRIVVSAFRLRERDFMNWPAFDNFLNGCLLRRPPRVFSKGDGGFDELHVEWSGGGNDRGQRPARLDPRQTTRVRLFSRDAGYHYQPPPVAEDEYGAIIEDEAAQTPASPGIGGWNDFNAVSDAARQTIREAAGIEIPDASFVLWVLAAYLTVLVPLNWLVFRLIGRVEWAWIAAPMISVACAGVVIKLAQLDIGFARSNTEIAVVELQADYPRAHVTRFNALYTSLSTPYEVKFDDSSALVQPYAIDAGYSQPTGTVPSTVNFLQAAEVTLTGFHVLSNRTGLVHSEQMLDLGGNVSVAVDDGYRMSVANGTPLNLQQAALVRRSGEGAIEMAWIGDLKSAVAGGGVFEDVTADQLRRRWRPDDMSATEDVGLNLWPLVKVALDSQDMEDGQVRLVALALDQPQPGMSVVPAGSQRRTSALVVANLRYSEFTEPQPDQNTSREFVKKPLAVSGERQSELEEDSPPP